MHSITNYVVMNSTANVLLAMGASPIMAHATEKMNEIVGIASSIVINIRNAFSAMDRINKLYLQTYLIAGKPLVLDPVGAGATKSEADLQYVHDFGSLGNQGECI